MDGHCCKQRWAWTQEKAPRWMPGAALAQRGENGSKGVRGKRGSWQRLEYQSCAAGRFLLSPPMYPINQWLQSARL